MKSFHKVLSAEEIAQSLGGKRTGSGWIVRCPAHEDRNPSLSLSDGKSGPLWHCHAGCSQDAVTAALREKGILSSGIGRKDEGCRPKPFEKPEDSSTGKTPSVFASLDSVVSFLTKTRPGTPTVYDYPPGPPGIPWGTLRIDFSDGGKTFRPFQRTSQGVVLASPPGSRPLFRADRFDSTSPVYVVEGEKCVLALESLGLQATTSAHGAESAKKSDWSPLSGCTCILWPDNDEPGQKYGRTVSGILRTIGATVRKIDVTRLSLPPGGDADDWVRGGGKAEALTDLVGDDPPPDWKEHLILTDRRKPAVNDYNLIAILANDEDFSGRLRYNAFDKDLYIDAQPLSTVELTKMAARIEKKYGLGQIGDGIFGRAVEAAAHQNLFHPVRDWLDSLDWDGVERVPDFFPEMFGPEPSDYLRTVSKNLFVAAVARAFCPGSKFDHMVILEGPQGIRKSTALFALFGEDWTAEMKASPDDKDFDQTLQGLWCVEFAELSAFGRSDAARIKLQLSVREDYIRLPYARRFQRFPRQCVFIGTTNDDHYLKDPSGGRRFWPVRCVFADLERIRRDREQLWAEAVHRYRRKETWWEIPPEAGDVQFSRYQFDSWEEIIEPWLRNLFPRETTTTRILEDCLGIERGRHGRSEQMRVGAVLKRLGWERVRCRTPEGLQWKYVPVPTTKVGTGGNKVGTPNICATVPTVPTEMGRAYGKHPLSPGPQERPGVSIHTETGRNVGTGRNNPRPEPCSHLVPTSGTPIEVGTDEEEVE